jgi:RND family efflux transporter MFP subunit
LLCWLVIILGWQASNSIDNVQVISMSPAESRDRQLVEADAEKSPSHAESPIQSSHSTTKRPPWGVAIGVALVLLAGGGAAWYLLMGRQGGPPGGPMPGMMQGIPVQVETLEMDEVQEFSEFIGSLESRNSVVLRPEIDGRVSAIYVESGDVVEAGTPLVQLSPEKREAELASVLASVNSARAIRANAASELQALQAERIAAAAEVDLQNTEYERIADLVEAGALPQQNLDVVERDRRSAISQLNAIDQRIQAARASLAESDSALEQARANAALATAELQDTTIVAPFSGTVGDIPVKLGDFANSSTVLTTVTQNQALELRLSIPIERRSDLRPGLRVELTDNQGNDLGIGQISFISPQVDANAQSILAKATFANASGLLLDGQYVRARVIWDEQPGVLVPATAISRIAGETFVFVAQETDGEEGQPPLVAEQRRVRLGILQGNDYQVLEGLAPGEQVVVSGILNLSDGAPINPDPQAPPQGM